MELWRKQVNAGVWESQPIPVGNHDLSEQRSLLHSEEHKSPPFASVYQSPVILILFQIEPILYHILVHGTTVATVYDFLGLPSFICWKLNFASRHLFMDPGLRYSIQESRTLMTKSPPQNPTSQTPLRWDFGVEVFRTALNLFVVTYCESLVQNNEINHREQT